MSDISQDAIERPFGQVARASAIESYLSEFEVGGTADAWKVIYGLLLWIDPTTGLAHCYESDKSQPGRHWYPRTLAFHNWVAGEFGVRPRFLYQNIDYLFKHCLRILAVEEAARQAKQRHRAELQFAEFKDMGLPEPGENPELEEEIQRIVFDETGISVPTHTIRAITGVIVDRLRRENKRKNLLGEGFEDCLAAILRIQAAKINADVGVFARHSLSQIPGFRAPAKGDKERTVDLAVVNPPSAECCRRTLLTVKWSVRADREEQFGVDFDAYAANEASGTEFDYVFISNEFDAARLLAACNRKRHARPMFSYIVHICPEALRIVHENSDGSWDDLREHLELGRLIGFGDWLVRLGLGSPQCIDE